MGRMAKGCLTGCGVVILLFVLLIGGSTLWFRSTFKPKPADPKIGKYVALRPLFLVRGGEPYSAGTASAVRLKPGGTPIVITAQHLFGPDGGMEPAILPGDLNKKIRGVALIPFGGKTPVGMGSGSLRKSGTFPEGGADLSGDVAAFKLAPKSRVNALELAPANPKLGEWVWLVGDIVDHEPQTQTLFPAQVLGATDKKLSVKFPSAIELQAFSGAPLINSQKQVVGILISGGGIFGFANPASGIRKRLEESGIR